MADRKSIRKPPRNPPPGLLTRKRLMTETGASKHELDAWGDIVPQEGWFYREIAINVVLCIQVSPDKKPDRLHKKPDRLHKLRLAVWSEGFDHNDIFHFIDQRLALRLKELAKATPAQREQVIKEAIRCGSRPSEEGKPQQVLRNKPLQPIFSSLHSHTNRSTVLEWAIDIARGIAPAASLYDRSTKTLAKKSALLAKVIGGVPHLQLDIEKMAVLERLRWVTNDASAAEREQVRQDYARLTNIIARVTRPVGIIKQSCVDLIRLWRWLDIRVVFVPFMIDLRRRGYGEELEKFLEDFKIEVTVIPNGPVDYSFGDPPTSDTYLDVFEVPPGLPAMRCYETELHAY